MPVATRFFRNENSKNVTKNRFYDSEYHGAISAHHCFLFVH